MGSGIDFPRKERLAVPLDHDIVTLFQLSPIAARKLVALFIPKGGKEISHLALEHRGRVSLRKVWLPNKPRDPILVIPISPCLRSGGVMPPASPQPLYTRLSRYGL